MFKKLAAAALTCALAVSVFTGCGSDTQTKAERPKDELVFVNYRDIRDLNPHLYAGEMYAQEMLYETLTTFTEDGGFKGVLAESWDISPDGKTYTFHIREGVKFHDGEVCDAYAIKANFDAIIENKDRHTWLEMMHLLEGVSAPDAKTFVIKLSKPYYPMLTELSVTRPFAMISPKAMKNGSTKNGVEKFIGTGPYMLGEVVTDEYAVFEANPNYWGPQPKLKKILVKVIPDNQTRVMALEKGEIDLIFGKNMLDVDPSESSKITRILRLLFPNLPQPARLCLIPRMPCCKTRRCARRCSMQPTNRLFPTAFFTGRTACRYPFCQNNSVLRY